VFKSGVNPLCRGVELVPRFTCTRQNRCKKVCRHVDICVFDMATSGMTSRSNYASVAQSAT
jgi:hypothetical protein